MRFGYDQRWNLADQHARKLADAAYENATTKEEKARLYLVTYRTFMQEFARENSERVTKVCPECGRAIPTGDRCPQCSGV